MKKLNFIFVVSSSGSVMNEVLKDATLREDVRAVVADRSCKGIQKAQSHEIPVIEIFENDPETFCSHLGSVMQDCDVDYVLSFYTRFFSQSFRDQFKDRILNFHPSLLPAFKGNDAFNDSAKYHVRYIGSTVEVIDQVMDEGKIVMQTVTPMNLNIPLREVRHTIFTQQCQSLLQVHRWLKEGRITVREKSVEIKEARYDDPCFSPALESPEIIGLAPAWQPE